MNQRYEDALDIIEEDGQAIRRLESELHKKESDYTLLLKRYRRREAIITELLAVVDGLLLAIDEVGVGLFGPPKPDAKTWKDAKADWWQALLAAVEAAEKGRDE